MSTLKSRRPKFMRLLGKQWAITWSEDKDFADDRFGHTDHDQLEIRIADAKPPAQWADTMVHEVIHAIEKDLDLKMRERQVKLLGTTLLGWMVDNPEQLKWILDAARRRPGKA